MHHLPETVPADDVKILLAALGYMNYLAVLSAAINAGSKWLVAPGVEPNRQMRPEQKAVTELDGEPVFCQIWLCVYFIDAAFTSLAG